MKSAVTIIMVAAIAAMLGGYYVHQTTAQHPEPERVIGYHLPPPQSPTATQFTPAEVIWTVEVEATRIVEVTRQVPVEVTREVVVEVTRQVPVEVTREVDRWLYRPPGEWNEDIEVGIDYQPGYILNKRGDKVRINYYFPAGLYHVFPTRCDYSPSEHLRIADAGESGKTHTIKSDIGQHNKEHPFVFKAVDRTLDSRYIVYESLHNGGTIAAGWKKLSTMGCGYKITKVGD